jgi:hypothetical protein
VKRKVLQHVIEIASRDAMEQAGVVVLELEDEQAALEIARRLALTTGREVNLLDEQLALIETIPAATVH